MSATVKLSIPTNDQSREREREKERKKEDQMPNLRGRVHLIGATALKLWKLKGNFCS